MHNKNQHIQSTQGPSPSKSETKSKRSPIFSLKRFIMNKQPGKRMFAQLILCSLLVNSMASILADANIHHRPAYHKKFNKPQVSPNIHHRPAYHKIDNKPQVSTALQNKNLMDNPQKENDEIATKGCSKTQNGCPGSFECTADYIIVGAGSAGCVVASRLAAEGYSVIILEAGPDTSVSSHDELVQYDKDLIAFPINFVLLYNRFNFDPNSFNCGGWNATQTLADFVSTDQNGVYYAYPRGLGAGGSVSHHAMQDGIGSLQLYDNIAAVVEDNYWLGSNINRLFRKMENVLYAEPNDPCPGTEGWLSIQHTPVEPLLSDISAVVVNKIGVPYRDNFCNPQDVAGIGNADVQITADRLRSYVYPDLLEPVAQETGKIKVIFNCLASQILLQETKCPETRGNKYKAIGVKAFDKGLLQEFQPGAAFEIICDNFEGCFAEECVALTGDQSLPKVATHYLAKKEVIVCCGAIQSPQLLMLSGIGPKEHVESVGIKSVVDLPGVGSDVLDHNEVVIMYEINPLVFIPSWQASILLAIYGETLSPEIFDVCVASVEAFPNVFDTNTASIQWDWYSQGQAPNPQPGRYPFPDTHSVPYQTFFFNFDLTYFSPQYPGNYFDFNRNLLLPDYNDPLNQQGLPIREETDNAQFAPFPRVYLSWLVENLIPHVTNGTIRLASRDPRQAPIIQEQLFEDDKGVEQMALMIQQIREVMENPAIKDKYSIPGQPWEIIPGPNAGTVDQVKQYINNWSSYGHHISGTCQMGAIDKKTGKAKNKNTVLDSKCRVLGVDNLRVADTSVYVTPWLHAFNTSRAAYVVGEAVSEFIINKL